MNTKQISREQRKAIKTARRGYKQVQGAAGDPQSVFELQRGYRYVKRITKG